MKLLHEATIKNTDGTIEITIWILNPEAEKKCRQYTYVVNSEWVAKKFLSLYKRKATHGKALALLNKFKIKEQIPSQERGPT